MAQRRITIRFQKHNRCCPDNVWMTLLYVLKGTPYHIKGRIHTSSFDKNGKMEVLEKNDQKLMMNTFRIRYQKIDAKVIHHARQMNLSFSSAYRNQNTFLRYYNKVVIQS